MGLPDEERTECARCCGLGVIEEECVCGDDVCCCAVSEPPVCDACNGRGWLPARVLPRNAGTPTPLAYVPIVGSAVDALENRKETGAPVDCEPHKKVEIGLDLSSARSADAVAPVLDDLYASEINFRISTFWDGGFDVELGDDINGFTERAQAHTLVEAVEKLRELALARYPDSDFAKRYARAATEPAA